MSKRLLIRVFLAVFLIGGICLAKLATTHITYMRTISPSGRKIAVVETNRLAQMLWLRSRMYVYNKSNPHGREFVGLVLNNRIDPIKALIWHPDENEIAIVNDFDGTPAMVVVVTLADKSGMVTIPDEYAGISRDEVLRIIRTEFSVRNVGTADLRWLACGLAKSTGEGGNMLESVCRNLNVDPEDYR